jgi:hypothetical protein
MSNSLQATIDASCRKLEGIATAMGIELSYAPSAVKALEEMVVTLRSLDPDESALTGATFMVGAYFGEILRQRLGGIWRRTAEGEFVLEVNGSAYAPVAKVRKFAANTTGEDGLDFFASAVIATET